MLGEFGGEACDHAEHDADENATEGHDEKGRAAEDNVQRDDVVGAHVGERVEHSIKHLMEHREKTNYTLNNYINI